MSEIGNNWELLTIKAHIAHNKIRYLENSVFEKGKTINPAGQKGGRFEKIVQEKKN